MRQDGLTLPGRTLESSERPLEATSDARFREIVDAHYDFIWRSLRITMAEISALLDLPVGTVASRLRRARREFRERVARLALTGALRGGDT